MRVIAGALGGRLFASPRTHRTHPMSDKMRGALFNMLGDISGYAVLDAFGGTGALSFEAASRGAASVVVIEQDRSAQRVIAQNIQALGLSDTVKLIKASANAWLQTAPAQQFDLVLCDPPYDNLQPNLLARLAKRARAGTLVLSWPSSTEPPAFAGLELAAHRVYGDASLAFYRRPPTTH